MVCINKWDINPEMAAIIETDAVAMGMLMVGRIRYDRAVTRAQIGRRAIVECQDNGCAGDIRAVWKKVIKELHPP